MNKAFVKEPDAEEDEVSPALRIPPGTRNYMTLRGHRAMLDEFERLVKVDRPELVKVVAWAAGNGDRSENGDYIYGKKRLRELDRRIRFLTKRLETAVVIDPVDQSSVEQVFFGATVTLCEIGPDMGDEVTYQIVGIDEADASLGRISWISPLARALLKAREGESIRFESPAGWREIEIIAVRYE